MKNSYILTSLVASLNSLKKRIGEEDTTIYNTASVRGDLDAIYMDMCRITNAHAEDVCVTKSYSRNVGDITTDQKDKNVTHVTKKDYMDIVTSLIDAVIEDARDYGFCIEGHVPFDDETPGGDVTPRTPNNARIVELLQVIEDSVRQLIEELTNDGAK